ncbi:MAG TPA: two-component regulator propeller domain-containing protein [Ohtaekwangia sp.]|uniref:hybrid sensor histidine kinase/response regulator transcription factor n=1 Tax=Ohtaekwangia sp. TaxID=2066019 RepID=UPI002F93ADCC
MLLCPVLAIAQPERYQFMHVNVNDGLSHNEVLCLLKDRQGFLWIGTASGLNRYDGYSFKVFLHDSRDSTSLSSNSIQGLFEIPDGRIGVLTSGGLNLYDPSTERFQSDLSSFYTSYTIPAGTLSDVIKDTSGNYWFIHTTAGLVKYVTATRQAVPLRHNAKDPNSIASDTVSFFAQDNRGNNWVIHANGILERVEMKGLAHKVVYRNTTLWQANHGASLQYRLLADKDGDLWIFIANDNQGIYYFNASSKTFQHFHKDSHTAQLNNNIVRDIAEDNKGMIWVGTDHGGINVVNKKDFSIRYIVHRDEDEKSLSQNSINVLYKDNDGIIWAGTYKKGISYYHENIIRFPVYRHLPVDPAGLPYADVNRFVEDDKGNLWIGTNGGGLLYFDRTSGKYTEYRYSPTNPNSIGSDVIVSLCIDHEKKLWIGTYYGGLICYDGKKFIRFNHNPADPSSLSNQSVWEIFEDSRHRLWVGTLNGGLNLFDARTQTFSHYRSSDMNSVGADYIAAITEDRHGNLWIGTTRGIDILNRERGRFLHYESENNNPKSLSNNSVLDIRQDSKGRVWIATAGGLNLYDEKSITFTAFTKDDGLPHNTILTILEDASGDIWMSTPNGLSRLSITTDANGRAIYHFKNYGEAEGLQGKQFNENAACKTSRGELVFGGANGFNIFKPEQLGLNKNIPRVVFTDFQLFNKSIRAEENIDGKVLLPTDISQATEIVLPPDKNVFSIEFAALNFFHPEKNEYKYKLEGFDADWLTVDSKSRKVTFTNLDPGNYTFHVKAANNDGVWNNEGTSLRISVLPPFWKTRTALVLYFLLIISGLLITRKLIQQREKMKFVIQQERQEAMRMHELDMMKIKFFTNVSHEFRTPLTLILTPLEKILKQTNDTDQRNQFQLIQRNAKRLLNLVNQLLDFRKLEVQEIKFNSSEGDIIYFIREAVYSFSDLSEKKDIKLQFESAIASVEMIFDQDKLEKILFNLLSNAFKFTPEHGAVTVRVDEQMEGENRWLCIQVEDTGIGIAADKQEKIFERFFQNELPKSMVNQGSGIGLSITKEFVKIHGGTIAVTSEPGKGSCFTVRLPLEEVVSHKENLESIPVVEAVMPMDDAIALAESDSAHVKKPLLLLVEDNEDFRFYLKDNLKLDYQILEAPNGLEGWRKVEEALPDLIVSDIMMPEMNGIELCRKVKSDQRVSHIPVILLTARAAEEQKVEGFQMGADDYITKPFNFEILASRIQNLINQREKYQKAFPRQLDVKASELNITPLDEKFIQNAIQCVEKNVSKADFSVEDMSKELGISRAHLYKKILSLTGKSPLEFIRTIRLQQAAQLLEKSQLTVAEIAYQVGFNNPKYFARYFKEQYSVLPSAYASGKRKA